jgi:hypothetical protein
VRIANIKKRWVRRTVLVVAFVPALTGVVVMAAVQEACDITREAWEVFNL